MDGRHEAIAFCFHTLLWGACCLCSDERVQHREVSARQMPNRRHGRDSQIMWMTILCILNNQNPPNQTEHYPCYHELEVCINATQVLRFWLEPAELDEEMINFTGNSLKGQIPLQLAELGNIPWASQLGKHGMIPQRLRQVLHTKSTATAASFAMRMFNPRLSYLGYLQLCVVTWPNCSVLLWHIIEGRIKSMAWFNSCVTGLSFQHQELQEKHETLNSLAEACRTFMFPVLEMMPKPAQNIHQISKFQKKNVSYFKTSMRLVFPK